ncbi:hypothetical protein GCM10022198_15360 [Klugiella xanthotipulae]|uniref:DNA-binding FadR family transcriptional regulator n=1 Tax=Klugiella xanthotipulae TaxID=244735 RepID=A0A543HGW6_9MICO|nr:FCD domain-containing protein [Klugiella xanthotipulae]TQM57574.1 DNA-binding FadR family transcriptional regulator [Klugiella xanthotipulae]
MDDALLDAEPASAGNIAARSDTATDPTTPVAPPPPAATAKAWETVLAHIEAQLAAGILSPGDRLPGERALATGLGVGRSSVREALRVLEVLGLIRTQTGSGPSSGAIIVARPSGGMSILMRLQVAAQGFAVADVVKTRLVLETAVARELAETRAHTAAARELLDAMGRGTLTDTEFLLLDAQFHLSLAEATGNDVLTATMAGLRSAIEAYVIDASAHVPDWPRTMRRLQQEHRDILAAIDAGRPGEAAERVAAHISGYYAETRITDAGHHHTSPTTSDRPPEMAPHSTLASHPALAHPTTT